MEAFLKEESRRPAILVVEDCADIQSYLKTFLHRHEYMVTLASSGNEALRLLEISDFDAVVSDIQMPNGSGLSLLRTMRANGNKTPVLIMTAVTEMNELDIIAIGGSGLILKPLNLKRLLEMLHSITYSVTADSYCTSAN